MLFYHRMKENRQITSIAYASRTLQQHESRYGVSELEALAVVWATKHRTYLYGHPCDVYTDHEALQALLNTHPSGKLARWGMALQEMDLHLQYRPGKTNQNADTLPCKTLTCHLELPEGSEEKVVAALTAPEASAKDREEMIRLAERQMN